MLFLFFTISWVATQPAQAQKADGKVVVIKMVDKSVNEWRFEPADVSVTLGDTLRWIQEDVAPHNVQFTGSPEGAKITEYLIGPFLIAKGSTYELVIDEKFLPGTYLYVCTPHAPMGMKAQFEVVANEHHNH